MRAKGATVIEVSYRGVTDVGSIQGWVSELARLVPRKP